MNLDWNSVEQLKALRSKIDRRLNQLIVVEKKQKRSHLSVFESCNRMYNYDISHIYKDMKLSEERKFYVYVHCDPFFKLTANTNGKIAFASTLGIEYIPFYVGKGEGDRAYDLNRNGSHRKKRQMIEQAGKEIKVKIIKEALNEREALELESKLIDIFGLTSFGGYLLNLDEGVNSDLRKACYTDDYINVNKMLKRKLIYGNVNNKV